MAFLPRLPSEFNPVFRLLDDYDVYCPRGPMNLAQPTRKFTPKFDIRESNNGYHLEGELPGVEQDNIEIEFTDPQTLIIKGRSQRNSSKDNNEDIENDSSSETESGSTKSRQPTVEDEGEETSNNDVATPKSSDEDDEPEQKPGRTGPVNKYLVSERSIGEFHRTFTFPSRIEQDGVKARLRNGILSVQVPREAARAKKIRIE